MIGRTDIPGSDVHGRRAGGLVHCVCEPVEYKVRGHTECADILLSKELLLHGWNALCWRSSSIAAVSCAATTTCGYATGVLVGEVGVRGRVRRYRGK